MERTISDFESCTSSPKVHEQAYGWYKECREHHETCKRLETQTGFAPSRLIDVGVDGDTSWRLCLYPEDIADPPSYLTLSYRWAQEPAVALLGSTLDEFRRGAPIESLPKTFRDAIVVARRFSIRYLWIDSLCIIQDSPDDWARESVRMHEVYANSACNIAASASDSPEGGLFRSRVAHDALLGYVNLDLPSGSAQKFEIWDQFFMDRLTQGPLAGRGWVFQERVLSSRVLHFCESQVAWECFDANKCEMFPKWAPRPTEARFSHGLKTVYAFFETDSSSPSGETEDKAMSADVYAQWLHLVKTYSACALTCPDDRLIAMLGIAEMYRRHTGDDYLAGLWRSRLTEGLNWVVVRPAARPRNRFRVPSWSWAAVDSPVLPQPVNFPRDDDLIQVIRATVEDPETQAGWQHITGALELRGCISTSTVTESTPRSPAGENVVVKLADLSKHLYAYPDTTDATFEEGTRVYILPLRSTLRRQVNKGGTEAERLVGTSVVIIEGLLLEPVPGVDASYRRIGHFVVSSVDPVKFFGLVATLPWPEATAHKITADDTRATLFTLV